MACLRRKQSWRSQWKVDVCTMLCVSYPSACMEHDSMLATLSLCNLIMSHLYDIKLLNSSLVEWSFLVLSFSCCMSLCVLCRVLQMWWIARWSAESRSEGQAFLIHLWGRQHKSQRSILMTYDSTQRIIWHTHAYAWTARVTQSSHVTQNTTILTENRKTHHDLKW